ncbi:hypothetical protein J6590_034298 [Homalodisca vitripennis]|nr:hypothetical protein J6590_034298 [Homalodisca vitripennis]
MHSQYTTLSDGCVQHSTTPVGRVEHVGHRAVELNPLHLFRRACRTPYNTDGRVEPPTTPVGRVEHVGHRAVVLNPLHLFRRACRTPYNTGRACRARGTSGGCVEPTIPRQTGV